MGRGDQARQSDGRMRPSLAYAATSRSKNVAAFRHRMFLLVGGRDREPVDDIDVLLRIDRHRAVVGAEHHAVGAEHLDRLAHMRRPEAHGVDVQELEIVARHLLAADHRVLGHALAAEPPAEIEPAHARQQPAAHVRDARSSAAESGRTGRTGSSAPAPWRCRTAGRSVRRACTGPSAASWPIGTRSGWMKTGTWRSCAHSQNAKESSPSMKRPCQLEQISRPLKPSDARQRSPSAMWLLSSGLSVPMPQSCRAPRARRCRRCRR